MKTDVEIRERIKQWQANIDEEDEAGHSGEDDWFELVVRKQELLWVLGE